MPYNLLLKKHYESLLEYYFSFFNILFKASTAVPAIITKAVPINTQAIVVILFTPFYFIIYRS